MSRHLRVVGTPRRSMKSIETLGWRARSSSSSWLSSLPIEVPLRLVLRFARAYFGKGLRRHRADLLAIAGKAARIRAHAPRYG